MNVREAKQADIEPLARLWFEGWKDAHQAIVPVELAHFRTYDRFLVRTAEHLTQIRTIGPLGEPLGFYLLKGEELDQLYVAASARGKGTAQDLMEDAEASLAAKGLERAFLICAAGNDRAARFYEKSGWTNTGEFEESIETPEGVAKFSCRRFEKQLHRQHVAYTRPTLEQFKELLKVFADAFDDQEHYQAAIPSDEYLNRLITKDDFIPLVAVADDKVVAGLAAYVLQKFEQERSEIYIYDLAVSDAYRRRRLATGLINKLREIAREIGAYVIYVQADPPDAPAVMLYESLGTREDVFHFDINP